MTKAGDSLVGKTIKDKRVNNTSLAGRCCGLDGDAWVIMKILVPISGERQYEWY